MKFWILYAMGILTVSASSLSMWQTVDTQAGILWSISLLTFGVLLGITRGEKVKAAPAPEEAKQEEPVVKYKTIFKVHLLSDPQGLMFAQPLNVELEDLPDDHVYCEFQDWFENGTDPWITITYTNGAETILRSDVVRYSINKVKA